jgi:ubiquinone/menaquinone biosynthesis C-methylase UbiE
MSDKVPENVIQDFWTDYPMIFYGKDTKNSTPEEIFDFMEQVMRDKGRHLQNEGEPLLSKYIDYSEFSGKKVLEIGFGTGWLANEFLKVGAELHGIDLSHSHLELSKYRFRDQNVDLQIASAEAIPFADETFDMVASWGVLHHASDDQRCYDEVYRVLKKGGRCFLMLYRKGGVKYYYQKIFKHGILRGGLIKHRFNFEQFIHSVTDVHYDGSPGAPISRHYVRRDLEKSFEKYSEVNLGITGSWGELDGIPAGRFPLLNWILPFSVKRWLLSIEGGYWIVDLKK